MEAVGKQSPRGQGKGALLSSGAARKGARIFGAYWGYLGPGPCHEWGDVSLAGASQVLGSDPVLSQ